MYNMISNMRDSMGSAGVEAFISILIIIIGILVLASIVFQFLTFRKIEKLNDKIEKLKNSIPGYTDGIRELKYETREPSAEKPLNEKPLNEKQLSEEQLSEEQLNAEQLNLITEPDELIVDAAYDIAEVQEDNTVYDTVADNVADAAAGFDDYSLPADENQNYAADKDVEEAEGIENFTVQKDEQVTDDYPNYEDEIASAENEQKLSYTDVEKSEADDILSLLAKEDGNTEGFFGLEKESSDEVLTDTVETNFKYDNAEDVGLSEFVDLGMDQSEQQTDEGSRDDKTKDEYALQEEENISITEVPVSEVAEAAKEVIGETTDSDGAKAGIIVTPDVKTDNDMSEVMNFNMTTHSMNTDTVEVTSEEFGKEYGVELEKLFGSPDENKLTDVFEKTITTEDDEQIKESRMRAMEHFSDTFHSGTNTSKEILEAVRLNDLQNSTKNPVGSDDDVDRDENITDELTFDEKLKRVLKEAESVADEESESTITREELEKKIQI